MEMSRVYTDYLQETILTLPDKFINVKTGETQPVSPVIQDQIAYHANNNTLIHLVFSALNHYLHPQEEIQDAGSKDIMVELLEIKKLLQQGYYVNNPMVDTSANGKVPVAGELKMEEVKDILEAYGG